MSPNQLVMLIMGQSLLLPMNRQL